ncbi:MAG: TlyA family rRNA (cytidine-2'-O)-methyltransferase, partial [Clostridia bacterium]|nr:TlyA family rRNA (cytidine-2'-O)-methyltransferase [Clostridia bacterium]
MKGIRADVRLVEAGLAPSREKARSLIMAGLVYHGEVRIDKAGEAVAEDAVLDVRENPNPFVSRGGLKLAKAIKTWNIDLCGVVAA